MARKNLKQMAINSPHTNGSGTGDGGNVNDGGTGTGGGGIPKIIRFNPIVSDNMGNLYLIIGGNLIYPQGASIDLTKLKKRLIPDSNTLAFLKFRAFGNSTFTTTQLTQIALGDSIAKLQNGMLVSYSSNFYLLKDNLICLIYNDVELEVLNLNSTSAIPLSAEDIGILSAGQCLGCPPPPPTPSLYNFSLDSYIINECRSRVTDDVSAAFSISVVSGSTGKVTNLPAQSVYTGDSYHKSDRSHAINLAFNNISLNDDDTVHIAYIIYNNKDGAFTNQLNAYIENITNTTAVATTESILNSLTIPHDPRWLETIEVIVRTVLHDLGYISGTIAGDIAEIPFFGTLGGISFGSIGAGFADAAGTFLVGLAQAIYNVITFIVPNCDGPVGAYFNFYKGADLKAAINQSAGKLISTQQQKGLDSQPGCGANNSNYTVNWSATLS